MKFNSGKFLFTLIGTVILGIVAVAILRSFGIHPLKKVDSSDPNVLLKQADAALAAVARRQPGERRPASYDSVLAPLDKTLESLKTTLETGYDMPDKTYATIRPLATSLIDVATRADQLARNESGFLTKEYRFNSQKAEACQYLANALWEKMQAGLPRNRNAFEDDTPKYSPSDLIELRRILDAGLTADPGNRELWYIRGVVNRAEGLFAPAAKDLERAVEIDNNYAAAWNTLGLVRITLREFDKAQEALERARALALEKAKERNEKPGAEYASALYNLATFHEGLAAYYNRENMVNPTVESKRQLARHTDDAKRFFQEFLEYEPPESPYYNTTKQKLQNLPR